MKRSHDILFALLLTATAGCTAPATSPATGSFWSSGRGASINDSLDQTGAHVAKFERQAEEIQRDLD